MYENAANPQDVCLAPIKVKMALVIFVSVYMTMLNTNKLKEVKKFSP